MKIRIIDILVILLGIASFSPLVIPENQYHPMLWGIPYSMWMGFVISLILVALTYVIRTLKKEDEHDD